MSDHRVGRQCWQLFLCVGLTGCYTVRQAWHQNELFNTRRSVAAVLGDPATPSKLRGQLTKVQQVLAYAADQGLNTKGAYDYLIETKDPVVSYIVQAAQADRLEFVTWWFPVIGDVPYLGFFRRVERDAEAAKLRGAGYDVSLGGAGAFSSLGWFDDPIFSSMLERGDAELAHLFFHELTHRTVWVAGSSAFNENLAEYVATLLTSRYMQAQAAAEASAVLQRYQQKHADKILFTRWLRRLKTALSALYVQPTPSRQALLEAKRQLIQRFMEPPLKPAFALVDYVSAEDWNNASILGAALYAPDLERFAKAHRCFGSERRLADFLAALRRATDAATEPFSGLDALCEGREEHAHVD